MTTIALQRPPAELLYADQLALLRQGDGELKPPGWALSMKAARSFILGDASLGIAAKIVAPVSSIERMLVTLATGRGLMLVGEPGTAKSLLSELLACAVSGGKPSGSDRVGLASAKTGGGTVTASSSGQAVPTGRLRTAAMLTLRASRARRWSRPRM